MAGKSTKEMNPLFQHICDRNDWKNITELSREMGSPTTTIYEYAYKNRVPTSWLTLMRLSEVSGKSMEEIVKEMISLNKGN